MLQSILAILSAVVIALQKLYTKKEEADAQEQADAANTDPTEWFTEHFGVQQSTSTDGKTDADKTESDKL